MFNRFVQGVSRIITRPTPRARHQLSNAEYHLSLAELQRLIAAAQLHRDRLLIQLFVETGIRRCEAAALAFADIDVPRGLLVIRKSKGNKTRLVPVSSELAHSLAALNPMPGEAVFVSRTHTALSCRQINRIVASAGKVAGIRNPNPKYASVTCHLLRHSFARHWKASGGSIESLSKIFGHSSVKTTWDEYGTESFADVQRNYAVTLKAIFRAKPTSLKARQVSTRGESNVQEDQ